MSATLLAWIVVAVAVWDRRLQARYGTNRTYTVRVEGRDGRRDPRPDVIEGNGTWAGSLGDHLGAVTSVAIVDEQGRVWCRGRIAL